MSDLVLRDARNLIASREHWAQNYIARDSHGGALYHADDPKAVKWCARGAIMKIAPTMDQYLEAVEVLDGVSTSIYGMTIEDVNDILGHLAVMHCFGRAIG